MMKKMFGDMKDKAKKVLSLNVSVEQEPNMPLTKRPSDMKYVVHIISVWADNNGDGQFYRVLVWPENLENMSKETKWVRMKEGDLEFEQSVTFHHRNSPSPLSKFMLLLEVAPPNKFAGRFVEPPAVVQGTPVGTGSVRVPTEPLSKNIHVDFTICDEDGICSGSFLVRLDKSDIKLKLE